MREGPAGVRAALGAFGMDVAAETRPWPDYPRKSVWRGQGATEGRTKTADRRDTGGSGGRGGREEAGREVEW